MNIVLTLKLCRCQLSSEYLMVQKLVWQNNKFTEDTSVNDAEIILLNHQATHFHFPFVFPHSFFSTFA